MPFSAVYWGFLSPRGRVLLPRPEDEHHVHLGKRIASRLGLSTAYDGKSAPIRADYIAFDVSETGCSQFIGLQDGRGFRRRVVRFLREDLAIAARSTLRGELEATPSGRAESLEGSTVRAGGTCTCLEAKQP